MEDRGTRRGAPPAALLGRRPDGRRPGSSDCTGKTGQGGCYRLQVTLLFD
jgi:hypothetical protein